MEACEPIHRGRLKHDGQVVYHDISVTAPVPLNGGIACEPLLRVGVTFILLDLEDFEVRGPLYSP